MTTIYPSGDTIRVRVTFRDYAVPPAVGDLIDPDTVEVNIYDANQNLMLNVPIGDPEIVNEGTGIYSYQWTLPDPGTYYIEFVGIFGNYPEIIRHKIKTKWKPVT
jgi:hypothetical protein